MTIERKRLLEREGHNLDVQIVTNYFNKYGFILLNSSKGFRLAQLGASEISLNQPSHFRNSQKFVKKIFGYDSESFEFICQLSDSSLCKFETDGFEITRIEVINEKVKFELDDVLKIFKIGSKYVFFKKNGVIIFEKAAGGGDSYFEEISDIEFVTDLKLYEKIHFCFIFCKKRLFALIIDSVKNSINYLLIKSFSSFLESFDKQNIKELKYGCLKKLDFYHEYVVFLSASAYFKVALDFSFFEALQNRSKSEEILENLCTKAVILSGLKKICLPEKFGKSFEIFCMHEQYVWLKNGKSDADVLCKYNVDTGELGLLTNVDCFGSCHYIETVNDKILNSSTDKFVVHFKESIDIVSLTYMNDSKSIFTDSKDLSYPYSVDACEDVTMHAFIKMNVKDIKDSDIIKIVKYLNGRISTKSRQNQDDGCIFNNKNSYDSGVSFNILLNFFITKILDLYEKYHKKQVLEENVMDFFSNLLQMKMFGSKNLFYFIEKSANLVSKNHKLSEFVFTVFLTYNYIPECVYLNVLSVLLSSSLDINNDPISCVIFSIITSTVDVTVLVKESKKKNFFSKPEQVLNAINTVMLNFDELYNKFIFHKLGTSESSEYNNLFEICHVPNSFTNYNLRFNFLNWCTFFLTSLFSQILKSDSCYDDICSIERCIRKEKNIYNDFKTLEPIIEKAALLKERVGKKPCEFVALQDPYYITYENF